MNLRNIQSTKSKLLAFVTENKFSQRAKRAKLKGRSSISIAFCDCFQKPLPQIIPCVILSGE